MDKIFVIILVLDSLLLISSSPLQLKSSTKDEIIDNFLKITLPLIKQNMINKQEFDSFYKLLTSNEDNPERIHQKKANKMAADLNPFESVKRKLGDDYGHLRFGRNDGQSQDSKWSSRIKYNDPDYGHMRFG